MSKLLSSRYDFGGIRILQVFRGYSRVSRESPKWHGVPDSITPTFTICYEAKLNSRGPEKTL